MSTIDNKCLDLQKHVCNPDSGSSQVCICVFVPLLVHECVIVKWRPGLCLGLKGRPVGGPETCSGVLGPCLLLNHTDVLGLLWPYRTLQGPSGAISRLRDAQRGSQEGSTTVTSVEISEWKCSRQPCNKLASTRYFHTKKGTVRPKLNQWLSLKMKELTADVHKYDGTQ